MERLKLNSNEAQKLRSVGYLPGLKCGVSLHSVFQQSAGYIEQGHQQTQITCSSQALSSWLVP